ncbi:MAG: class IV adenylate cyclase [Halobacteriovoraceae bacterium]|jgi:adenylate cyclase, class 2|nr:class IV adenylate cyclase [Halobacteriovoraceae bacterium]
MSILNIEIKARCGNVEKIKAILKELGADFKGIDHQIDTYFKVESGRLKLRQGNIENSLIFYKRSNISGPKKSEVLLERLESDNGMRELLLASNGLLVEVDKERAIYFIENVKFHLDEVKELGTFVEIEAIDRDGSIGIEKLHLQCSKFMELFGIQPSDLVDCSYSDLLRKS